MLSTDLDLTTSAGRTSELIRISGKLNTASSDRILSALGHPGYGDEYATKVLKVWQERIDLSLHQIVYGTWIRGV